MATTRTRPPLDIADARVRLSRTPETLAAICAGWPDHLWQVNEGPGTWSAREVVCHLLHGEDDDWIPRMRVILEAGRSRRFEPFDREKGNAVYGSLPPEQLLNLFAEKRAASLAAFDRWRIVEPALQQVGIHPEFGEVTLEQLLATWVTHDLAHLVQIARIVEKYYGRWAGPWRRYFSALKNEPAPAGD